MVEIRSLMRSAVSWFAAKIMGMGRSHIVFQSPRDQSLLLAKAAGDVRIIQTDGLLVVFNLLCDPL